MNERQREKLANSVSVCVYPPALTDVDVCLETQVLAGRMTTSPPPPPHIQSVSMALEPPTILCPTLDLALGALYLPLPETLPSHSWKPRKHLAQVCEKKRVLSWSTPESKQALCLQHSA